MFNPPVLLVWRSQITFFDNEIIVVYFSSIVLFFIVVGFMVLNIFRIVMIHLLLVNHFEQRPEN